MALLELMVGGDVDVISVVGVVGPSSDVSSGGAKGEFLDAEACKADGKVDLCALRWCEGGVE